jgi:hypothetical protein
MTNASAELFESLIGQDLGVATAAGTEAWRVVSVKRRAAHALRSDPPFNVVLLAPASNDRRQGTRTSELPDGTAFEFFAVPFAADTAGVSYELVYN